MQRTLLPAIRGRLVMTAWLLTGVLGAAALLVAGWALRAWLRPGADAQQVYERIHAGHLARLDRHAEPGRVVFVGHSSFVALDTSGVTPDGLNLSLGGESTERLLARAATYSSLRSARVVLVNTGLNDLLQRCQPVADLLMQRITGLAPASVPMLVVGVQSLTVDLARRACAGRIQGLIDDHNIRLQAICAHRPGCRFVAHPVDGVLSVASPGPWHEPDGIHLSSGGYRRLRHVLVSALHGVTPAPR